MSGQRDQRLRIVVANGSLAGYPEAGGLWAAFLQYLVGLDALGHRVFWLEVFHSSGDRARDHHCAQTFQQRFHDLGFRERFALLFFDPGVAPRSLETARILGVTTERVHEVVRDADLAWDIAHTLDDELLYLFRRRVLIDVDPGHLQVSGLEWNLGLENYDALLTVGGSVGSAPCDVPTLGREWYPFLPSVYLPAWPLAPDPGPRAPFTSVTQWNWGELWLGERVLGVSKRAAYLRYLDLPTRADRSFELAANIHPEDDTGDRELLTTNGWHLVDPHAVAGSPRQYQAYIHRSRAELQCPKPIFRELKTGWFSDRSACYLASGRPVLAEDTGFGELLPVGEGLLAFRNLDEAVDGVARIDADYTRHARAARAVAEEFLDTRVVLPRMLEASMSGAPHPPVFSEPGAR